MDHATLVEAMRVPGFYPQPVDSVTVLQTHISSVFLTGTLAYKLKKPVNFGFLDFSTSDLRHRFCDAELALNRRLAPSVYLRVEPITLANGRLSLDGTGEAVDWVVVMRQMDRRLIGPEVLGRGELDERAIDRVVDLLVPFYREAATGPGVDEFGRIEVVRFNHDENFEQTLEHVGTAITEVQYNAIRAYADAFLFKQAELFKRRVAEGWTRECHGDLHLGNIVFEEPPVIFDCIEFNERFRCSDVAVDLAFLVMDLEFRGRPELARRVVDRYVAQSRDVELPKLVNFYCCYRAYVRGKIACLTMASLEPGDRYREQLELARRYFDLAYTYATGDTT